MENPIYEFKKNQKELAARIRSESCEDNDSYTFRHNHIAYCEIRGRSREEIEIPRDGNEPSEFLINKIKEEWLEKITAWRMEIE